MHRKRCDTQRKPLSTFHLARLSTAMTAVLGGELRHAGFRKTSG